MVTVIKNSKDKYITRASKGGAAIVLNKKESLKDQGERDYKISASWHVKWSSK